VSRGREGRSRTRWPTWCRTTSPATSTLHRKPKGRAEVRRLLEAHVPIAERPAALLLRSEAYDLLQGLVDRPCSWPGAAGDGRRVRLRAGQRQAARRTRRTGGARCGAARCRAARARRSPASTSARPSACSASRRSGADQLAAELSPLCRRADAVPVDRHPRRRDRADGKERDHRRADRLLWWTIPKEKTKNARHAAPRICACRSSAARARSCCAASDGQRNTCSRQLSWDEDGSELPIEQKVIQSAVYHAQPYCKTKDEGASRARAAGDALVAA
jgi:hypothetical protein